MHYTTTQENNSTPGTGLVSCLQGPQGEQLGLHLPYGTAHGERGRKPGVTAQLTGKHQPGSEE